MSFYDDWCCELNGIGCDCDWVSPEQAAWAEAMAEDEALEQGFPTAAAQWLDRGYESLWRSEQDSELRREDAEPLPF